MSEGASKMMTWNTKIKNEQHLLVCTDITWSNIKTCINDLSFCNGDEVFGLCHVGLGFVCRHGAGFKSNERTEVDQQGGVDVKKGIRLEVIDIQGHTYNLHANDTMADVQDDFVVIGANEAAMICLHFEGKNCLPWSEYECKAHGDTIAQALRMLHIDDNVAAKIKRGALGKKLKRKR